MESSDIGPIATQLPYFDFTLLFEDAVLAIPPAAILLCIFPLRSYWLWQQPRKITRSHRQGRLVKGVSLWHGTKLALLSILAVLDTAAIVLLFTTRHVPRSRTSAAAAVLSLVAALALCALSHLEHVRSVRPSSIINTYLLFALMVDCVRIRTLWLRTGFPTSLAVTSSVACAVRLASLLLEAYDKRAILLARYRVWSPEATSGVFGRRLFLWLNPLLVTGSRRILGLRDMYPLDNDLETGLVYARLNQAWSLKCNVDRRKKREFLWTLLWSLRWSLVQAIIPRLCVTFFQYMQPFLISAVINFLQDDTSSTKATGWALTAAYGLDYVGLAVVNSFWMHMTYRTVILTRSVIVSAIYAQTVELDLTSLDESAAVTLMSADVERIGTAFMYIHGLWASPLDMLVGLVLLERRIGVACVGPALLSLSFGSIVLFIAMRFALQAQRDWVGAIQIRIDATTKMLSGIKIVKMLGLTSKMARLIQGLREEETRMALRFRRISVARLSLGKGSEILAPGIAFAGYAAICAASGTTLDVAKAYASLNIISLMTVQLGETIQNLPTIFSAIGCVDRIQDFLNLPTRHDHRLQMGEPTSPILISLSGNTNAGVYDHRSESEMEMNSQTHRMVDGPLSPVIQLKDATFAWIHGRPVVNEISLSLKSKSITFVIGPVGSGKSTLLKGIMGEVSLSKGVMYNTSLTSGFVDQTPWIPNGTVRDIVIGTAAYDIGWYRTVMHACCLNDILSVLPRGDQTKVGSGGISLSGGQKQRVAIARAIYSKQKLLLLDDCFSGLDAMTEERIFERLLGTAGLLREQGFTVLLATHAVHKLSMADEVIALDECGRLADKDLYLSTVTVNSDTDRIEKQEGNHVQAEEYVSSHGTGKSEAGDDFNAVALKDPKRSSGDWSTYASYFRSCGWHNTTGLVLGLAGFAAFMRLPDVWITFWTTASREHGNSVNGYYLGVFLAFEFVSVFCLVFSGCLVFLRMTPSASLNQHRSVLNTVMAAPLFFFTSIDLGITLNRFSQDMNLVDIELPPATLEFLAQVLLVTVQAVLVCLSAAYFAASLPFVLLILYFVQNFYLRTSRQLRLLEIEARSPLYSHFVETLQGLVTIRSFGWVPEFQRINTNLLEASQEPFYLLYCVQRWLSLVLDMTVAGLAVLLMVLFVSLRGSISPGLAGVALVNVNGFSTSLTLLVKAWTLLETSMGAISRIQSFTKQTASEHLPDEKHPFSLERPQLGTIEANDLTAAYDRGEPILNNITLRISAGQKVGICGPSGSGKSSIICTLFRMVEITHGQMSIDGVDITQIDRNDLRMQINAIPQEPFLFRGTIRENVDPHGQGTDEECQAALEKVRLWSILDGKDGLNTPADPDMFSHGQRQLFCLARAMLHPGKLVVLDEATSSVDVATEEVMQRIIREQFADRTVIAVAHRLNTIMDFDKIAMLGEGGRLIEFDTPAALMSRDSAFKSMYQGRRQPSSTAQ